MSRSELEQEFLGDHRKMTRAFRDLIDVVTKNDVDQIRALATHLNQIAGPHIAFEESILYPTVDRNVGDNLSQEFRREHNTARAAIAQLVQQTEPLSPAERKRVLQQLQVGFDHAVSCGSLLSHLTVATADEQQDMLQRLQDYREQQCLWTEAGRTPTSQTAPITDQGAPGLNATDAT